MEAQRTKKEQLEVELAYVRWLRTQNGSRMKATLQETKARMRRDERRMAQGEDIPRSVWLRQVAESEKTAPIRADKEMVERLARENVLAAELATRRARDQERQAERLAHLRAKIESSQQRNVEYRLRRGEMEAQRAQLLVARGEDQFAPGTDSRADAMIAAAPALDIANDDEPLYH